MDTDTHPLAEEVIRLLAATANAARLYPPSSDLPEQARQRFVVRANEVTDQLGPMRYTIDPHEVKIGDTVLASGQGQVTTFIEALHAMQVGQLVIAPGVTIEETMAFAQIANLEPAQVRSQGIRELLMQAQVSHIAVIAVSLRKSEEEGILGIDLTNAPLEEIGPAALAGAEHWNETAADGDGIDNVAEAIGRLEDATREIAASRVAEALMMLDERSRMRILAYSLRTDSTGKHMKGMFDVVARMNPAALARLLMIVAAQAGADPSRLAGAIELPPEVAEQVALLLAPSPRSETECGVPAEAHTEEIAEEIAEEEDHADLARQVSIASPSLASGKALATTVAISRVRPTEESVDAVGEVLARAARDGAFQSVREALRQLDQLASDPALVLAVEKARGSLQDPEALADVCRAPFTDADAAIAGEILTAAGPIGAEALLDFYLAADEQQRSLFGPVLRGMGEPLLQVASRKVRTDDSATVQGILGILPLLGDKRAVSVMSQALDHLDAEVRAAAVHALADTPGPEARQSLSKAVNHWDPETRRYVIREIGRVGAVEAIPALVRILEDINFLERNHELRKEVIKCLESLGSADALPVLRRWAGRKFVFGRKNKELRFLAQRAIAHLSDGDSKGVDTP